MWERERLRDLKGFRVVWRSVWEMYSVLLKSVVRAARGFV